MPSNLPDNILFIDLEPANRVAHWMIKLGHKYSDNLGYWHRQRSKSCRAGTLRPIGLLRQQHDDSIPPSHFAIEADAANDNDDDDDDADDAPSDTNRWTDVVQFAQDYINKKKTLLADAPRLKCCICQEELYYAGFNSRRGDRHTEAACVTSCGHIIGAMCYEKWHIGCLVRGASFENEDDDEEGGEGGYRLGTVTCPLCRTVLHCQKCGEPCVPWDAADQSIFMWTHEKFRKGGGMSFIAEVGGGMKNDED
ncbi:hypothetical protein B0H65DRAFT_592013 [Neurospora tetraspora]|uniref:RING-type domain-containing protein n=1 Tax=Neurospora tetraspora TaxID=94610 RepID=A0AAE0MNB8_9PEZI|nr:hypothetical protein B0H65DRAFT_592013 [Neurospora tetraspora]